jgi:predicted negative regulator of RcsB-dependent stress response
MAKEEQKSDLHFAEDEQTEKIRDWWKKNGTAIIVGLVIGIGAVSSYQGWTIYQARQAEAASDLYQAMLRNLEAGLLLDVRKDADRIISKYESTAYVDAASLMLAKLDFDSGNAKDADEHLRELMDRSSDAGVKHIARLRRISIALDRNDFDLIDELLSVRETIGFESRYEELKGDSWVARKDIDRARDAYKRAFELSEGGSIAAQILERKLNSVTRENNLD